MVKERGNSWLRFLDKWLGVPLLFILSLFRRRRVATSGKVGVMKLAGIGDTVLLSPHLGEVVFFSGRGNRAAAELMTRCRVVELDVARPCEALKRIRKEKLDVLYDAESWSRFSALLALFSKASTVGFKSQGQWRHFGFDRVVEHSLECHESENLSRLLGCEKREVVGERPSGEGIVVHMFAGGSRSHLKEWPKEYWQELFSHLQGEVIYATGSAKDFDRNEEVIGDFPVKNMAGCLSLSETAELLKSAKCVISVDTGIMHLAAAMGVNTIALHGPTCPKRWGGVGKNVHALVPKKGHQSCLRFGFEKRCKQSYCMRRITPERVFATFLKF